MSVDFHFLNVGYGDCTIIYWPARSCGDKKIPERIMMLDIFQHENHDEYEDAIAYYKKNFRNPDGTLKPIFRFVCSHPHQDHICGLYKLFADIGIKILNFWDLNHSFVPSSFDGHPTHEDDWSAYDTLRGKSSPATVLRFTRESKRGQFWDGNGDRITVLSPSAPLTKHAHYKDDGSKRDKDAVEIDEMSYALSIDINGRAVILAGDGRATPTWDDIIDNCEETLKKCYVLKAGHHGHECSFHEEAVKVMTPGLIILSNSKDEDAANGAATLYQKACPHALIRKTWEGNIVVKVPFDTSDNIQVIQ